MEPLDIKNPDDPATVTTESAHSDLIKDLIKRVRGKNKIPRSPVITPNRTGAKYAGALQTARKYGIDV